MASKTQTELQVGDPAPDFEALDDQGTPQSLSAHKGKSVVLYFYPKDDTPGCTTEACDFRDQYSKLRKKGAVLLGVSPDDARSHAKFKQKHELPFPLIVDADKKLCNEFGVWKEKSMYGRKYMGVERSTFVIGPDGKIEKVYAKVKARGHAADVLAEL